MTHTKPDTPSTAGAESLRYMKARTIEARKMGLAEARGNYISVACAFESNRKELVRATAELARLKEDLATVLAERDGFCAIAGNANRELARLRLVSIEAQTVVFAIAQGFRGDNATLMQLVAPLRSALAALATNTTQPGSEDEKR